MVNNFEASYGISMYSRDRWTWTPVSALVADALATDALAADAFALSGLATDADTDMNFLKNRGHGADKPRTCVSTDL